MRPPLDIVQVIASRKPEVLYQYVAKLLPLADVVLDGLLAQLAYFQQGALQNELCTQAETCVGSGVAVQVDEARRCCSPRAGDSKTANNIKYYAQCACRTEIHRLRPASLLYHEC